MRFVRSAVKDEPDFLVRFHKRRTLTAFTLTMLVLLLRVCVVLFLSLGRPARAAVLKEPFDVLTCLDHQPFGGAQSTLHECPKQLCRSHHVLNSLLVHMRERFIVYGADRLAGIAFSCVLLVFADVRAPLMPIDALAEQSVAAYSSPKAAQSSSHSCVCNFAPARAICTHKKLRWLLLGDSTLRELYERSYSLCKQRIGSDTRIFFGTSRAYYLFENYSVPSSAWQPNVVFVNVGLHKLSLPPARIARDVPLEEKLVPAMNALTQRFPKATFVWVSTNCVCATAFNGTYRAALEDMLTSAPESDLFKMSSLLLGWNSSSFAGLGSSFTTLGARLIDRRATRLLTARFPQFHFLDLTPVTMFACPYTRNGDGRHYPVLDVIKLAVMQIFN